MILFETDKRPLTFLLDQVDQGELALPDFQRSFVWDANATRELIASIVASYPAGSLLLLQGGAKVFRPRSVEEAPPLSGQPPYLVLDGQQRLTSLYQSFTGKGSHRFFLNKTAFHLHRRISTVWTLSGGFASTMPTVTPIGLMPTRMDGDARAMAEEPRDVFPVADAFHHTFFLRSVGP